MRTFIAIDLDEAIRRDLGRLIDRLRPECPRLRWVRAENIHLTIKFLGEVAPERIADIGKAMDALASECQLFGIDVSGVGTFPPGGSVRVVWVGVQDESGALRNCHAQCESLLEPLGFAPERRPFSGHLTIARNKSPAGSNAIRRALADIGEFTAGSQCVEAVTLYESTLTPKGSIYRPLSRHSFESSMTR